MVLNEFRLLFNIPLIGLDPIKKGTIGAQGINAPYNHRTSYL